MKTFLILASTLLFSCSGGGGGGSKAPSGQNPTAGSLSIGVVKFDIKATNLKDPVVSANPQANNAALNVQPGSLAIGASLAATPRAQLLADPTDSEFSGFTFLASSIASGAPDEFTVYVKSINLECFECATFKNVSLFESAQGVALPIDEATIDLSALITAAAAEVSETASELRLNEATENSENTVEDEAVAELAEELIEEDEVGFVIEAGSYNRITMKVASKATIKGCVSADMRDYTGDFFSDHTVDSIDNTTITDFGSFSGSQTYCTKEDESMWGWNSNDDIFTRITAFKVAGAETMDLKLGSRGDFITTGQVSESDLDLVYELPETVTVAGGEATQLSFVMDLNRLLRFETSAKDMRENKTETGGDEDPYPSYFFDTTFESNSFAFIGLPGKVYGYEMDVLTCKADDFSTCSSSNNDDTELFGVKAWMTIITAPDGSPLSANIMPADDNILTVMKGKSEGAASDWLTDNGDQTVNIKYSLDGGVLGEIRQFNSALDDLIVGSSVIVPFAVTSTTPPNAGHDGYVKITRRL